MDLSDTKRLKALEDENAKLKRLLADTRGGPHRLDRDFDLISEIF